MRKYQKILILFLLLIYLGNCFCGCESITGVDVNRLRDRMYRFSDNDYLMDIWYDGVTRLQNNAEEQSTGGQSTEK